MWDDYKSIIRDAFDGQKVIPFRERPSLPADMDAGVTIAQIRVTRDYAADLARNQAQPVVGDVSVTLDWIALESMGLAAEAAIQAAYFTAAALARERLAPDVAGCDRAESIIEPHADERDVLIGREVWIFGR